MSNPALHRRTVLGGLAAGALTVAGCVADAPATEVSSGDRWPQHGRDPGNTGYAPDADGPTEDATVDWHREIEDGYVRSQPLVGDGIVLNAASGGRRHLDPGTGDLLWRDRGSYAPLTPAIDEDAGVVYLPRREGLRAVAADGGLELLDRRFRYERWTGDDQVRSPVTLADGVLVVGVSGGPDENGFAAVDAADGTDRWFVPVETQIEGAPVVTNETAIAVDRGAAPAGTTREVLAYAVSLLDGEREWAHTFGTTDEVGVHWRAGPVATDDLVYVPTTRAMVALDPDDGAVVWRREFEDGIVVSPAVADDTLYVGSPNGELLALEAETGAVRWRDDYGVWLHAPVVADETVYVVDSTGEVGGWSLDGERRFRLGLGAIPVAQPVVGAGRLYVTTETALFAVR